MTDYKYLHAKRILVTGGTGFLGRHLTKKLQECKPAALWSFGRKDINLLDRGQIEIMLTQLRPHVIFHLAAVVGGIGANQKAPGRFFYENLRMGIDLLECVRKHKVDKTVVVGTVCAYPKFTEVPFKEADIWNGYPEETNAPYGLAKKMLMVQSKAYREQYGTNSIYLLMANLFGPGDNTDLKNSHVIPALIHKFYLAKKQDKAEVELWGTGTATREFLYVDDAVNGLIISANQYNSSEPINIGTGTEVSIRDVAEKIAELMDFNGSIVWNTGMPDGQPRRCLDISRAQEIIGYKPKMSFDEGLKITINNLISRLDGIYSTRARPEKVIPLSEV